MSSKVKFIDLSIPIANDTFCDPDVTAPKIEYHLHEKGATQMGIFFSGLKPSEHLPDGKGWANENLIVTSHSGTHMDAPWHYAPIQDREIGEKQALTIDQIPLEWCVGPLIVLDCTDFEDGYVMKPADVDKKLAYIGHNLVEGDIVCVHTTAPQYFGTKEYLDRGVGIGKEATLHIIRQGVHVVGTDAWSWDAPFSLINKRWKESIEEKKPDPSILWEGHYAGIELGYFQMEKMANLDKVPPVGATIYCFPIKITGASAGWVRAVATVPK